MIDFSESKKMIKIIGKEDKSYSYNGVSVNISFFITELHQIKYPVVSVWFIHFSSYFYLHNMYKEVLA